MIMSHTSPENEPQSTPRTQSLLPIFYLGPLRSLRLLLGLAPALLWCACADEQPPRNTVQHGVIAKADLLGKDGKAV